MDKQDKLLDKVSMKTHVSKQDILALASDLQTKDFNNQDNIKDFVLKISNLTNKQVRPEQMNKIILSYKIIKCQKILIILFICSGRTCLFVNFEILLTKYLILSWLFKSFFEDHFQRQNI